MHSKKALLGAVLLSISIFSVILAGSIFHYLKKVESDFKNKEALLIKKNIDLEDELGTLLEEVMKKAEALILLEEENQKLNQKYSVEFDALKEENIFLADRMMKLEEKPLIEHLRDAIHKERNTNVRKFLEKVLYNIVLVKSGKSVELEPIVVATKEENLTAEPKKTLEAKPKSEPEPLQLPPASFLTGKRGKILSVDRRFNLIVINLGRKDNVKEEDRCVILKDEKIIAEARVINLRYRVSAAFVDEMEHNYNIRKIKEGYEVLIKE